MPKSILAGALLLLAAGANAGEATTLFAGPTVAGQMAEPRNLETSGLAASRLTPGLLWTHNDSGGEPTLFALDTDGALRGMIHLAGVTNRDWEDVTAFKLDGQAWLMVAETGDNFAKQAQSALHVVAEPAASRLDPARPLSLPPAYTINFVYEDGPRDCEAVAVDAQRRQVYLLTKRDRPTRLYQLPLAAAPAGHAAVARCIGTAWDFPPAEGMAGLSPLPAVASPGWPTAMSFLPDGTGVLVLTYGGLYLFPRGLGETWADALAHEPDLLPKFALPQAEALAVTPDGAEIYVASERTPQLLRYVRRK